MDPLKDDGIYMISTIRSDGRPNRYDLVFVKDGGYSYTLFESKVRSYQMSVRDTLEKKGPSFSFTYAAPLPVPVGWVELKDLDGSVSVFWHLGTGNLSLHKEGVKHITERDLSRLRPLNG